MHSHILTLMALLRNVNACYSKIGSNDKSNLASDVSGDRCTTPLKLLFHDPPFRSDQ